MLSLKVIKYVQGKTDNPHKDKVYSKVFVANLIKI